MNESKGFTIIELLVTLAVAAILVSVAAPQMGDLLRRNKVSAEVNDFVKTVTQARSVAVNDGVSVSVCQSADQSSCGGDGTAWEDGWVAWVDSDGDGAIDGGERIVQRHIALTNGANLAETGGASEVQFDASGLTGSSFTFDYAPRGCTGNQARTIRISATGRPRTTEVACP